MVLHKSNKITSCQINKTVKILLIIVQHLVPSLSLSNRGIQPEVPQWFDPSDQREIHYLELVLLLFVPIVWSGLACHVLQVYN